MKKCSCVAENFSDCVPLRGTVLIDVVKKLGSLPKALGCKSIGAEIVAVRC